MNKEREGFKSRLGFILISAGCAIGIGNVWRFPYVAGNNGGGAFVLFYLFFLIVVGVPILTMEFAIGRASKKSAVCAYRVLEKKGQKWHLHGYISIIGNYLLMMFYTTVGGWMLYYFYKFATGSFQGADANLVQTTYSEMLKQPKTMIFWMVFIVIAGFCVCSLGLQKGLERISKWMMLSLLAIMVILALNSFSLPGGMEGIQFYLIPDWGKVSEIGLFHIIVQAMNQAFFTLSLGIGAMLIFGSYMNRERSLLGESVTIALLDTFVALVSGLIIFPACFAFGVNPDSGPSLIFLTLPNVFAKMTGGRLWGSLFFLFMSFASFSTIIAVFENIMSCGMELWNISRKRAAFINCILIITLSLPCIFGFNLWSDFAPLGTGSVILDLEDFIVSNLMLPIGSLVYLFFCNSRLGWGFEAYRKEANQGKGLKVPKAARWYVTYVLPVIVILLLVQGLVSKFLT